MDMGSEHFHSHEDGHDHYHNFDGDHIHTEDDDEFWDHFITEKDNSNKPKPQMDLYDYGMCNNYVELNNKCVTGHNMEKFKNITIEECQYRCSKTVGCLGIEYFKKTDYEGADDTYEEVDCNLSDSLITDGCSAEIW